MRPIPPCAILFGTIALGCAAGDDMTATQLDEGGSGEGSVDEASAVDEAAVDEAAVNEAAVDEAAADTSVSEAGKDAMDSGYDAADLGANDGAGDGSVVRDATRPDSSDDGSSPANIAPQGTGLTWQSMTSSSANSGKTAAPAVNDNAPSTQVNIDSSTGDSANAWEAAGVIFSSGRTVTSVTFVQGTTGSDGWFEANFALQFSSDGATWSDSGWGATPAYAYVSAVSGKRYTFSGVQVTAVAGVRVIGQVNTVGKSWWAAVSEVMISGH